LSKQFFLLQINGEQVTLSSGTKQVIVSSVGIEQVTAFFLFANEQVID